MVSSFVTLFDDILLKILDYLDYKTLLCCQATCRKTNNIVAASVSLQYRIELAACGMLDSSRGGQSLDITERLWRLRLYDTAWRTLQWKKEEKFTQFIGRPVPSLDGNTLVSRNVGQSGPAAGYSYYTIPSTMRGVDEQAFDLVTKHPYQLHLLDVSQDLMIWLDRQSSQYHLRTLSTGDSHPMAYDDGIIRANQPQPHLSSIVDIREDLLLEMISLLDRIEYTVRNWKTGMVEYKASEPQGSRFEARCFLDASHIIVDVHGPQEENRGILMYFGIQILQFREGPSASGRPAEPLSAGPSYFFACPEVLQRPRAIISSTVTPWRSVNPLERGHFRSDPNDRLLSAVVNLPYDKVAGSAQQLRVHIPLSTFSSYIVSHPLTEPSISIDVPWDAWGPMGSRVTLRPQSITVSEVSAQGMRILCMNYGGLRKQTTMILDYHPARVARALMLERSGNKEVTILRGGTGTENTGFETTLPCIATNVPLPSVFPHLGMRCRGYLCENGVVIIELDGRTPSTVKDAWFYTT
ncbi:hypothetical protein BV25DRAFT_1916843 [Artomyces pyxidatus]|uniref:Uncharacterized protein n=1 Tax=Artomyces pyxidatus TaxID=48021 RepID=A0ACB8T0G2_9AGAM|nr:hypothetical protein BV25DRAFT_1916843 [Artomyces pyxidatus]